MFLCCDSIFLFMVQYKGTLGMSILVLTLCPTCWAGNKSYHNCTCHSVSRGEEGGAGSSRGGQSESVEGEGQRSCSSLWGILGCGCFGRWLDAILLSECNSFSELYLLEEVAWTVNKAFIQLILNQSTQSKILDFKYSKTLWLAGWTGVSSRITVNTGNKWEKRFYIYSQYIYCSYY